MIEIYKNNRANKAAPHLSVLIPYYRDDPLGLLKALARQDMINDKVEILLYDDGTNDRLVNERLKQFAEKSDMAIILLFAEKNNGRAEARNNLMQQASANWLLYLDADMLPISDKFLANYLNTIRLGEADIIFGGFEVAEQKQNNNTELHRILSQSSDCLSADERRRAGPQYVCSSNLCVRASVLGSENFDAGFKGWGWEDSEWAARVNDKYRLVHIDNPALHLGLESTDTLLQRFKTSGPNYARFIRAHPELAKSLPLYKIAKKLGRVPGQKLMRPLLKLLVKAKILPSNIRLFALKLWRASWYAEALS